MKLTAEPGTNFTFPGFSSQEPIFFPLAQTRVDTTFLQGT